MDVCVCVQYMGLHTILKAIKFAYTIAQFASPGGVGSGVGCSIPTVGVTTADSKLLLSECSDGTCTLGVRTMAEPSAPEEELAANVV